MPLSGDTMSMSKIRILQTEKSIKKNLVRAMIQNQRDYFEQPLCVRFLELSHCVSWLINGNYKAWINTADNYICVGK